MELEKLVSMDTVEQWRTRLNFLTQEHRKDREEFARMTRENDKKKEM